MGSLSQYQLSPGGTNLPIMNQNTITLNKLNNMSQMPSGMLNQSINHATMRPHNQNGLISQANGGLASLQNNIISNYATLGRGPHNQLNNHFDGLMTTQLPHLNNQNTHQQLTSLNTQINLNQFQLANNGLYASPQYAIEVGLDLEQNNNCFCCCFKKSCNISRVIAFICGLVVLFLMSLTIATSNWLTTDKYRQGLFQFCVDEGAEMPLPFGLNVPPGCYVGRDTDYIRLSAALCCFGFIFDLLATLMTGFGLCSTNSYKKYSLYKFALYIMIVSLIFILSALVIYPVWFASEIETSNRQVWEFGWSYGVGWGSCIFLFGAILLLLCDRESNELYYHERTIVHNPAIREVKA